MSDAQEPVVQVSEVGEYAYCARSWWLRHVRGLPSANRAAMQRGSARHAAHGAMVAAYHRLAWIGYVLLGLAALSGLALLWLWWKGV